MSQNSELYYTIAANINDAGNEDLIRIFIEETTGVLSWKNSAGVVGQFKAGAVVVTM